MCKYLLDLMWRNLRRQNEAKYNFINIHKYQGTTQEVPGSIPSGGNSVVYFNRERFVFMKKIITSEASIWLLNLTNVTIILLQEMKFE